MVSTEILKRAGLLTTAHRRPYYFKRILDAWADNRGIEHISRLYIALGISDVINVQMELIDNFSRKTGIPTTIAVDNPPVGPSRAIGQMAARAFEDDIHFLIFGEEDILPSSDMLELMAWGKKNFKDDPRVLTINGHSRCGNGWDGPNVQDDPGADERTVRLLPYFHPWGWGTWRDRWEKIIQPTWDYDLTTGSKGYDNGYEWNLATRIVPRNDLVCLTPDVSRSQHIGERGGWAATTDTYQWGLSRNFREHREPVDFVLEAKS